MDNVNFEIESFIILCPSCGMRLIEVQINDGQCNGKCDHCCSSIEGKMNAKMHHTDDSRTMCNEMYEYKSESSKNLMHELSMICEYNYDSGYSNGFREGEKYGYENGYDEGYDRGIQVTLEKYNIDE